MEFQDKRLKCMDCGSEFVFTAGEQLFFRDKGLVNEPKRCKQCKKRQVSEIRGATSKSNRTETSAICSRCGKETTVPFRPTQGRPVLCRECFQAKQATGSA